MTSRTAVFLAFFAALPLFPSDPPEEHRLLQQWRYRAQPVPVPAGGIRWEMEGASWVLESGKLWFSQPTAEGNVTGLVFEGRGRFRMAVPDPVELTQLRRFAERPELQEIDEPFTALVMRTAGDLPVQPSDFPATSSFAVLDLARERHEHWLTSRFQDIDARVLAALRTPGDRYVRAEVRTAALGWLTWDYDEDRIEEIRLERFNAPQRYPEVWLSLDKAADRKANGRPGRREEPAVDIEHADIAVDVTKTGRYEDSFLGQFKVGLRFIGKTEGARAVQLYLLPGARVTSVAEGGKPVPFVRDAIGKRRGALDDQLSDDSLLVLLDEPIAVGKPRRLDFEYEMELANYVRGRMWYPESEGDESFLGDLHTARIELTARKKYELRAMGKPEEVLAGDGLSHGVWVVERPTKMATFSFAEKLHEERVTVPGAPEVVCFGSKVEVSRRGRFAEVGRDVGKSLAFFGELFGLPLPPEEPIRVTSIAARHGQSFDGFLHLGEGSFDLHGPGLAELFRGHEAAHQWWGHKVGAATYRDSWLEEAFAEYSAMLFVEAAAQDGPKLFQEILRSYQDELHGLDQERLQQVLPHGREPGEPRPRQPDRPDRPGLAGEHGRGAVGVQLAGLRPRRAGAAHAPAPPARSHRHGRGAGPGDGGFPAQAPGGARHDRRLRGDGGHPDRGAGLVLVLRPVDPGHGDPNLPLELHADRQGSGAEGPAERCAGRLPDARPRPGGAAGRGGARSHRDRGRTRGELRAGPQQEAEEP